MDDVKTVTLIPEMSGDRFFAGFLAATRSVAQENRLVGSRIALNKAFFEAVSALEGNAVNAASLGIDFDPLYGVSPWFERALTRAQSDLLISFPNPTYATVEIKFDEAQADELLELTGHREGFMALARAFVANMKAAQ